MQAAAPTLWTTNRWLAGQSFLVTGAASGIGRSVVQHLEAAGATGLLVDRAASEPGSGSLAVQADVSAAGDWERLGAVVRQELGGMDILVNAAGVGLRRPLDKTSDEEIDRVLGVNLLGPVLGVRALSRELRASRGSVVNIASSLGLVGADQSAVYCASKGGVVALTRGLAAEFGRDGVRVNCVCPGPIDTPLFWRNAADTDQRGEGGGSAFAQQTILGRLGSVDEIAAAVVFLSSPGAGFITGAVIPVDGGKTSL